MRISERPSPHGAWSAGSDQRRRIVALAQALPFLPDALWDVTNRPGLDSQFIENYFLA